MGLEHEDAGRAAHPVDVGQAVAGLNWRRHCSTLSIFELSAQVVPPFRFVLTFRFNPRSPKPLLQAPACGCVTDLGLSGRVKSGL